MCSNDGWLCRSPTTPVGGDIGEIPLPTFPSPLVNFCCCRIRSSSANFARSFTLNNGRFEGGIGGVCVWGVPDFCGSSKWRRRAEKSVRFSALFPLPFELDWMGKLVI